MKKIVSLVLVCCIAVLQAPAPARGAESLPAAPVAAQAGVLTFDVYCGRVLAYYPRLKSQAATVELAIAKKLEAASALLPRVRGLVSMTTSNDQVYVFGTLLRQRAFTAEDFALNRLNNPASRTNYDMAVQAEMPVFDALQTVYHVRSAKAMIAAAQYDATFGRMEAILIASEAYLNAIVAGKLLYIVEGVVKDAEEDLKQAQDLKDKGLVLGADFYAAKVTLGMLKNQQNDLVAQKAVAYAVLNVLMGEEPSATTVLPTELDPGEGKDRPLEEWLAGAYASRPDLRALEETVRAQEAEVARERSAILPRVDAFGDLRENTQDFNTGGGSFAVGMRGSIDIFRPEYGPRVRAAREALRKAQYGRDALKDAIAKDLTAGYARCGAIRANIPIAREMAADAAQAVSLIQPLYREGRKSIADLLEMRQAYVAAHRTEYTLLAGSKASATQLSFLAGELDRAGATRIITGGE